KVRNMIIGKQTRTKVSICYLDDIANKDILNELINRLEKIDFDSILDSGFIVEFIEDSPYSPFDTVGSTERPDIAVAMMLQGHIVVVVDGAPSVLTVPFLMNEYFITNDDYYINFYFSSVSRIVRVISFFITVLLPAFYVAILTYHQEMIPSPLLFSISAAREGIPFPTVVETLGLLVVFEILREVGMRVPMQIGQSLSILGAVVLGTAAVEARLVSSSVIIVIALTGLTGIMSIKIKGPAILIRFSFVLLAGFLGLYGIVWGIIVVTLHLCSLRSFGVPYMMPYTSLKPGEVANTIIRAPLRFLNKRDKFVSGENKMKMEEKDISK
ncbi:MAG TPA: spore germination protein, partial [Clostridiaceae bacterium]|nr:spore germination protein [Clostridiaceae bacterium]